MRRDVIPAEELLTKARAVGQYYGFTPLSSLTEKARGAHKARTPYPTTLADTALDPVAEIVANFLRQCQQIELLPLPRQPLFIWHTNIAPGRSAQKKAVVQFHAFGADRALADAVVIRALIALTRDLCREEPILRVNSMGDKETRARYARELSNFFKKRASTLPEECAASAKRDAFETAELAIALEAAEDMPAPTEHLSDASRKRFEDLLEYLEMTETPYELSRTLLSKGGVWNDLCFELVLGGQRVAWGSRYGDFTHHFFPSAPIHATGAVFQVASTGSVPAKAKSPRLRFSFVHIGDEAKRLSIRLAEDFKKARVSITQHIGVESLTEQLHLAERQNPPYLLIMGRKEALEGSAILRNRVTHEETILPLLGLIDRLKAIA
jgi:histidyl-tRNA synthetase